MAISDRCDDLVVLGKLLKDLSLNDSGLEGHGVVPIAQLSGPVTFRNPWFTETAVRMAIETWSEQLVPERIAAWTKNYPDLSDPQHVKTIGVVNAGNIPLVGLHDLLCVYLSGHNYLGKNATDDAILLPWLVEQWAKLCPRVGEVVRFSDRLSGMDAVIATGSDNTARYFEYYFGKYPHIIRRNRNGVAILDGNETDPQLNGLGEDIFTYYGLGCRNVAKLFVPADYDLARVFEALYPFHGVMEHHKYMNNFDHHHAVYLLKGIPFLQNNFLIIREEASAIASPLAVVYFERYADKNSLLKKLGGLTESIQCVAAPESWHNSITAQGLSPVSFGCTQSPSLSDYADGVDTLSFLLKL